MGFSVFVAVAKPLPGVPPFQPLPGSQPDVWEECSSRLAGLQKGVAERLAPAPLATGQGWEGRKISKEASETVGDNGDLD